MRNTKFFFLGGVIAITAFLVIAATIDYRALNTNQFTSSGTVSLKNGALVTNLIGDGGGLSNLNASRLDFGTVPDARLPASSTTLTQVVNNFTFVSNVVFSSTGGVTFNGIVFVNSNITVGGKAVFNQQVYITKLESSTNAAPTEVIDFARNFYLLRTNNNVVFAEAVNWSTTNHNETIYSFTNSGAAPFTVTMHGTYQNMKAEEGNTLYCTNVGQLLVWGEHGQTGTNFYWRSR